MNIKNSSWMRGWMGPVPRPPEAQCHFPMFSTSQPGTGRCWRTGPAAQSQKLRGTRGTIGEGLLRLVRVKRLDVAGALGGTGAMDTLDTVDTVDCMDEGLRLAKGTLRHEKTCKGTDRHERAQNFERVLFFLADRKGRACVLAHLAKEGGAQAEESRLLPLNPGKHLVCEKNIFQSRGSGGLPLWGGQKSDK
jgi:hypothetical protein